MEFSREGGFFSKSIFPVFRVRSSEKKGLKGERRRMGGRALRRAAKRRNYEASREFKVNWERLRSGLRAAPPRWSSRLIKLEINFVEK